MKSKILLFIAALGFAVMLSSCGKVPQTEINAATAAIDSVKLVGADLYVPDVYKALVDSMNSVNQIVEANKSKLFKSYGKARQKLVVIEKMTVDAKVKTEERKIELKKETESLIAEVKTLVDGNKVLMTRAPRGKDGGMALQSIKSDIENIKSSITESDSLLAGGKILDANNQIKAAKEKALSIKTELEGVLKKTGRR